MTKLGLEGDFATVAAKVKFDFLIFFIPNFVQNDFHFNIFTFFFKGILGILSDNRSFWV